VSVLTIRLGILAPILSLLGGAIVVFLIFLFKKPFDGLIATLAYCFVFLLIARESGIDFPYGYLVEVLYIIIWIAIVFNTRKGDWVRIQNDICLLFLLRFLVSVLELINPAGADPRGWLHEIRSSGLDSFLLVPAGFLIFRNIN